MRVAVLSSPDSWYFRDLCRAAGDQRLQPVAFSQIASTVGLAAGASKDSLSATVSRGEFPLHDAEAVLVRTMPPGTLEQVVFRMDALGQLAERGVVVINSPRAIEASVDKYLTTARLAASGLPVPETRVCQDFETAMEAFLQLGGDVVVKPLFGGEGRGVMRIDEEDLAFRAFRSLEQLGAVLYLQRFIQHGGFDTRLLRIGERVFGMRRRNDLDWRTNVSRGAVGEPIEVDDQLRSLAMRASDAVEAEVAGVDVLSDLDGRQYVLEVNGVPGWKSLARVCGVDVARLILDYVEQQVRASGPQTLPEAADSLGLPFSKP